MSLGIAAAGMNFGGSLTNAFVTATQGRKAREYDYQMQQLAYQKNLEHWHRQNEYNSPASQMKRFKEAGLNPKLIYGQGSAGNASNMPQFQAPRSDHPVPRINMAETLSTYMNFKKKSAEVSNLEAIRELINSRAKGQKINNTLAGLEASFMPHKYNYQREYYEQMRKTFSDQLLKLAADRKISEKNAQWKKEKWRIWDDTGINIDKDDKITRMISKIFELPLMKLLDMVKGGTKSPGSITWD